MAEGQQQPEFDFDVGLSFAGEDRWYVRQVARALRDAGIRVFFDEFQQAEQWGEDLYVFFDDVFRKRARFAVVFISHDYVTKVWPIHEAKSAQARSLVETSPYLLPVLLDNSELPGLRPTVGYIDTRVVGQERLIEILLEKLATERPVDRVPRTPEEEAFLLKAKPDGWEYLLFGAVLLRRMNDVEGKWRDHEVGYSPPGPVLYSIDEAHGEVTTAFPRARAMAANVTRLLNAETNIRIFGASGEPGDADAILHLANRVMDVYEEFLDWSARLRGAVVPELFEDVFDAASRFNTLPLQQFREFVTTTVGAFDELPELLRSSSNEPLTLTLTLTLDIDRDVMADFEAALAAMEHSFLASQVDQA